MNQKRTLPLLAAAAFTGFCTGRLLQAQTASPVQSTARPLGLNIAAPVQTAASDAASAEFQKTHLPGMLKLVNSRLGESVSQKDVSTLALDPSKLILSTEAAVRVYFLAEGASYLNTLGFNTLDASTGAGGAAVVKNNARLIFPNASSQVSLLGPSASSPVRTLKEPLLAGDFVDLGRMEGGTLLDFFLVANGGSGGWTGGSFTADASRNQDKMPHMVSFAVADSPYLIIGFEDTSGGGDRDYNDLVFALNIGARNVKNLISAPEPGALLTMGGFLGVALCSRRRTP